MREGIFCTFACKLLPPWNARGKKAGEKGEIRFAGATVQLNYRAEN